ncbi:MAG TPA: winged helix-turn-helix transcriptional regulator, partial [Burkholderiales bacterium]|nr:winged helix-turn-helix transcriptional regulator [Burkholderiales bacterium]
VASAETAIGALGRSVTTLLPFNGLPGLVSILAFVCALALPAWLLHRRIQSSKALDSPARRVVYDTIVAAPGATPADVRARTGFHYTTCIHHVRILADLGLVVSRRVGGRIRLFENHGAYGIKDSQARIAVRTESVRGALGVVARRPGISLSDLAHEIGIAPSTAKHHVDALVASELVVAQRVGRMVRLSIAPHAVDAVAAALAGNRPQRLANPGMPLTTEC